MIWTDHPQNPLIYPFKHIILPQIIGDPTVLNPMETPDGKWHLWANSIPGIHHFISDDGISWKEGPKMTAFRWGVRCAIIKDPQKRDTNTYYLYFEDARLLGRRSVISVTESQDLYNWSVPIEVLRQTLPWERQSWLTRCLECPRIAYHPIQKKYYLFYSTGLTLLKGSHVTGVAEPTHIGVATSDNPLGPFTKRIDPLIYTNNQDKWHNKGAGAMNCIWIDEFQCFLGLNNGVYRRETDHGPVDGSAVLFYLSYDGDKWTCKTPEALLQPNENGRIKWKDALVYQMCLTNYKGVYYLYYNARSKQGKEYIGLSTCPVADVHTFLRKN